MIVMLNKDIGKSKRNTLMIILERLPNNVYFCILKIPFSTFLNTSINTIMLNEVDISFLEQEIPKEEYIHPLFKKMKDSFGFKNIVNKLKYERFL